MIARLHGIIVEQNEKSCVIDIHDVGYLVYSPATFAINQEVTLYTHMVVRDDAHELYGFTSPEEKSLFSILIGVSGVGPKTALGMLSLYNMPELVRCIRNSDAKSLSLVPGLGKKTAEKVIIDLKDKLEGFESSTSTPNSDLVEALISLGYKEFQIRGIAADMDMAAPIEKQIAKALQLLQK